MQHTRDIRRSIEALLLGQAARISYFALHPPGFFVPSLLPRLAVGSYPTFSPLLFRVDYASFLKSGIFSVTLSVPLGMAQEALIFMRRRALRCPDFPPLLVFRLKKANARALFFAA